MSTPKAKTHGAVIVTRVSTGKQVKESTSPETQLDNCRTKAAGLNLPIHAEYYDAGISGAFLLTRGGMQQALADIREGRADTLIVPNMDRYSRDREHQEQIKKAVKSAGGRLVFCDADYQDNAAGNLAFNIRGDFAVFEREQFRERTMAGKRRKLESGLQPNRGNPPYGYRVPTTADVMRGDYALEQLGRYVIVPDQADLIRWAFEQYAAGLLALPDIAKDFNARGVPTARGGTRWRATNFHFMFSNPVYKGTPVGGRWKTGMDEGRVGQPSRVNGMPLVTAKHVWKADEADGVPLEAPAIVDEATWARVQERLAQNRATRGGNPRTLRLLSGRVHCPECGARMICSNSHKQKGVYAAYYCGRRRAFRQDTGETVCASTGYSLNDQEKFVRLGLLQTCLHPDWVEAAFETYRRARQSDQAADPRRELAAIERALSELAQQEVAAVQAQIAGIRAGASPDAYAAVFADLAGRRKDMEDRRGRLSVTVRAQGRDRAAGSFTRTQAMAQALADVEKALTSPHISLERKRALLGTVVEKVIPASDGCTLQFVRGAFGEDTLQNVLRFYIDKLARDLEESVLTRQLIARLVSYNFPPGTPCPTFRLGRLDDGKLAAVGHMIAELVNGNVLAPDEPWIRDYLGLPAQTTGA